MEEWDLLNENRELTGKTHIRGEKLAPGELHLVIHVCIFNEKGQLLIQKRQKDKEGWPNYWDLSAAGSALKGETSQQAAEREVQEELGIMIDLSGTRAKFSYHFEEGFDDYWFITKRRATKRFNITERRSCRRPFCHQRRVRSIKKFRRIHSLLLFKPAI